MLRLKKPDFKELDYRRRLLNDPETMAFNKENGGTVSFNKKLWKPWYDLWMNDQDHFFAYVFDDELKTYIGEVSYYYEEEYNEYVLNIIIEYKFRKKGYGKEALSLLCLKAKENGLRFLCDDIDVNNPSISLFKKNGFKEVWRKGKIVMLKKRL